MKKIIFTLALLVNVLFVFSQQTPTPKRVSIINPSQSIINKIKKVGIDLTCGPRFIGNNLELELGYDELLELQNHGVSYNILIDDLTTHYSLRNAIELPKAKAALNSLKSKKTTKDKTDNFEKSLSLQNVLVGNPTQHDECSEINWPVPSNFQLGSMGGCLTVSETLAQLDLMRSLYPNLISVRTDASSTGQTTHGNSTGGTTWSGQSVYYVRISDNPDIEEASEPETLITGMTHAREVNSLMNVMYFMWYILENYNSDPFIKNVVDNQELYFIPIVNPDGLRWNEVIAPGGGGLQRKNLRPGVADSGSTNTSNNVRGVDLNRNFNYYWGWDNSGSSPTTTSNTYRGPSAGSEPETQIIQDFVQNHDFKVAVNHHGGLNSIVTSSYNGSLSATDSGREDEYAKMCHDLTHYNRYIYGSAPNTLYEANGDANDWMLGGVSVSSGGQTSSGSGKDVLAFAPENGDDFWPTPSLIAPIAVRAMRMNFLSVLYSGKFAKLHDLNTSDINSTSGNLTFGVEYLGKTYDDITLTVTPVSSNITSITSPSLQSGWSKLEQRNLSVPYTLDAAIQANDEIEFQVTLSNDDFVLYQANYVKYYQSSLLFQDDPDVTGTSNWTSSGGSWGTTADAYSGSAAITDSPSGSYSNNQNKTITLNTTLDLSNSSQALVQFYAKWDLERNYDLVQLEASTNGGSSWNALCGNYNKPTSTSITNFHLNKNTNAFRTHQSNNGDIIYDGDTMDKWVMEEIYINTTENSFLFEQSNVQFRFRLKTDASNREDDLTTTFDGFSFDDFKVIGIQTPCVISVPTGLISDIITISGASISWDNIASTTYDLRYRAIGAPSWTDITGLSSPTTILTGLTSITDYEVQVRSNCGTNNSVYSASINFTTLDVVLNYCDSASRNVNDEFISRVELNTIDNSSGAQFYSDFTSVSTTLTKDEQYTITVTPTWTGTVYNEAYSVWIDYNRDGDFNDVGEQVWTQGNTQATSVSGSFTIPSSAVENSTRMRVSMKYNSIPTSCETFQYGEVEDYTVVIEGSGPDIVPPVITLVGTSPVDLNVGYIYTEEGATAIDDVDGDITASIVIGGDAVNTTAGGTYVVTYDVNDAAGNPATQVTRTVNIIPDTTIPVISLIGLSSIDLNVGDTYIEEGATALDNIDGDITGSIVVGGDSVDTNIGGTYVVTYDVNDAAGNLAIQVVRTVNVIPDTTAPIITLIGLASIDISVGGTYTEQGATALDNIDGDITGSIIISGDSVDTNTGGTYLITYNVTDAAGNPATQVVRTVNVIPDTIAPVITLIGASTIDLNLGDIYTEQGATALDDLDGDITLDIIIGGTIDTNIGGIYLITYDVIDTAGNPAIQVIRTVNVIPDTTAPIITLIGASPIDLNLGDSYTDQGATATDNIDGDITANIIVSGDIINTNVAGTYNITYNVSDVAGNSAIQVTRIVNVLPDATAPIITLIGPSFIDLNVGDNYVEQGATATDNFDGDITINIVITDNVNTLAAGVYFVDYNVTDSSGNIANTVTRTVNVIADTVIPIMTLIGASTINLNIGDTYIEQGATASDNIDGDISSNIVVGGDIVDTNTAGTYTITYNVSDAAGNPATQLNRTVNINAPNTGCSGGIASFPYAEGFENTLGGWTQSSSDDLDWLIDANGTPSGNTGPASAVEGSFYLFVEASVNGTGYPNKRALLTSPCFNLTSLTEATFSFNYHMFGATDMGSIDLEITQDEGLTWTSIWSETGNKGNSWQTAIIDLSAYTGGGIQLRFNRFVGSTWQADIAIDNLSLIDGEIVINSCTADISSYPYAEGFENTLGGWTQSNADDINWTIDANGTPSGNTGPASAIQGSFYIFVEASGNGTGYPNKQAVINSPCYDLTGVSSPIFSFNYHMYGSNNMGTIALEASNDDGMSWTPIWSESGNKGNAWLSTSVDLSAYVGNNVQLRFNRITGSTWQADIAIDNISLTTAVAIAKNDSKEGVLDISINSFNKLTLYPNPAGDILNIRTSKGGNMSYRIINSLGQVVNTGKTSKAIIVDDLESGMYYIEVDNGESKMMERFIKE